MIPPAQAAHRLLLSCLIGLGLGLAYDFCHSQRHKHLGDLMFLPALFYGWLILGFSVCQGDLRMGYWTGLGIGFLLWRQTFGRLIRPVFGIFWKIISLPFGLSKKIFAKLRFFLKNLLASGKKSSTINKLKTPQKKGVRHDKA